MTQVQLENLVVKLIGDASSYQQMLRDALSATQQAAKGIEAAAASTGGFSAALGEVGQSMVDIGGRIQTLGRDLRMLTAGITMVGSFAVKSYGDFNLAMTEATSIMNENDRKSEELTGSLENLALTLTRTSKFGPTELAKGFYYLVSAGFSAKESMEALPIIANFATAGVMDLSLATDLATSSMMAFYGGARDVEGRIQSLTEVTDTLVAASILAQGTTQQFAQAFTRDAAATMRTYNIELTEGVALLMSYADSNIKGAMAGNTMARMIRLLGEAARVAGPFQQALGVHIFDPVTGKRNLIPDVLDQINNAIAGMTDEQKTFALKGMGFPQLQQKALLPLLANADQIRKDMEALDFAKISGTSKDVATRQLQAFKNQMLLVKNAVTVVAIEIGQMLAPALLAMANALKDGIEWWYSLSYEVKSFVVYTLAAVAAVGPGLIIFGMLYRLIGYAAMGLGGFTGAIATAIGYIGGFLNPLRLLVLAFTSFYGAMALIGAAIIFSPVTIPAIIAGLVKHFGGFEAIWKSVSDAAKEAWDVISSVLEDIYILGKLVFLNFEEIALAAWEGIKQVWAGLEDLAAPIVASIIEGVQATWEFIKQVVNLGNTLGMVIAGVSTTIFIIYLLGSAIFNLVVTIVDAIVGLFGFTVVSEEASKSAKTLAQQVEEVIGVVVFSVSAIATAIAAWKILGMVWSVVSGVLAVLHLQQLFGIALWIIQQAIMVGSIALLVVYKTVLLLFKVATWLSTAANWAWIASMMATGAVISYALFLAAGLVIVLVSLKVSVLTAAIALLGLAVVLGVVAVAMGLVKLATAALTLVFIGLVAVVGTAAFIAFYVLFTLIAGAVYGAYKAIVALVDVMGVIFDSGAFASIGAVFEEWGKMLQIVIETAKSGDWTGAWNLLKAGFTLAIEQIKAIWTPFMEFLSITARATWDIISATFMQTLLDSFDAAKQSLAALLRSATAMPGIVSSAAQTANEAATALEQQIANRRSRRGVDTRTTIAAAYRSIYGALGQEVPAEYRTPAIQAGIEGVGRVVAPQVPILAVPEATAIHEAAGAALTNARQAFTAAQMEAERLQQTGRFSQEYIDQFLAGPQRNLLGALDRFAQAGLQLRAAQEVAVNNWQQMPVTDVLQQAREAVSSIVRTGNTAVPGWRQTSIDTEAANAVEAIIRRAAAPNTPPAALQQAIDAGRAMAIEQARIPFAGLGRIAGGVESPAITEARQAFADTRLSSWWNSMQRMANGTEEVTTNTQSLMDQLRQRMPNPYHEQLDTIKELNKEIPKFDAAIASSAEGLARITAFQVEETPPMRGAAKQFFGRWPELFRSFGGPRMPNAEGIMPGVPAPEPAQNNLDNMEANNEQALLALQELVRLARLDSGRPEIFLEPAGLTGSV